MSSFVGRWTGAGGAVGAAAAAAGASTAIMRTAPAALLANPPAAAALLLLVAAAAAPNCGARSAGWYAATLRSRLMSTMRAGRRMRCVLVL